MNVNDIIDLRNSDIVHEFLNHGSRVRTEIKEKLTPMVASTPWMADYAAAYFACQCEIAYIANLFDFFNPSNSYITEADIQQRLRHSRDQFLRKVTDGYHLGSFPTPIIPYTEPEWRNFYTQIWVKGSYIDEIVEIVKRSENLLSLQLWEWLKANYPDYVQID